jgi:hypothetical protein
MPTPDEKRWCCLAGKVKVERESGPLLGSVPHDWLKFGNSGFLHGWVVLRIARVASVVYTVIYTYCARCHMQTAKLFNNGRSQAVRLPKELRFSGEDVFVRKIGNMVVLYAQG